ncbi:MAG: glycosyltransferase family 2 protein [Armatimonadetes bacterium]|nr:glycosyltransferase family 2 protein [Armatimonadota bacterium]
MRALLAILLTGLGGAGLAWVLAGYPLLLAALARRRRRRPEPQAEGTPPSVTLVISAFNETRDLSRKIRSVWASDYPADRLDVLIADDGSTDGTRELIETLAAEPAAAGRLRLLPATGNLGKPAQLNRLAAEARGEILVFTDARQPLEPAALGSLVRWFADPQTGGVTGAVEYRTPEGRPVPIGAFWRYESWLRATEARVHSCVGGAGPLMAVRTELFEPLPDNCVLDDVLTPLRVVCKGYRFVYAADAVAIETYAMQRRHEYDRRVRTCAGNFQLLRLHPELRSPRRNPIWWLYLSHKLGRLMVPWLLLALAAGTLLGWPLGWGFRLLGWLQLGFYVYAAVGWLAAGKPWAPKGSSVAYSLALLAATATAGLLRDLRGRTQARWAATEQRRR